MTEEARLNVATAITRTLRNATFSQNMIDREAEQRNEEQRQRERNAAPRYRYTLAELQERVRRHYSRFGIHDVRVQWSGAGVEILFCAGLSTWYATPEAAIKQCERFGGAVLVSEALA